MAVSTAYMLRAQDLNRPQTSGAVRAVMIIILPSEHTGGVMTISQEGLSFQYDCSKKSADRTTVLAWSTSATCASQPVLSGYRLALWYDLLLKEATTHSPRPQENTIIPRLAQLLDTWQTSTGRATPRLLMYLLDCAYPHKGIRAGMLKAVDAQKATVLSALATQHGFALGLAHVKCHAHGGASHDSGEDLSYDIEVVQLVDAQSGRLLAPQLTYEGEEETIPYDWNEEIVAGGHDHEEYDDTDEECISIERWYTRTALVIWPIRNQISVLYSGKKGFKHACKALERATAVTPLPEHRALVDVLMARNDGSMQDAARVCCGAACRWQDVTVWTRVVEKCAEKLGLNTVSDELKFSAVELFGFEAVRLALESMVKADSGNATRLDFLRKAEDWLGTSGTTAQGIRTQEMQAWIDVQRSNVLKSLRKPTTAECALLLEVAKENGGMPYLKECMIPQLVDVADGTFLLHFADALHTEASMAGKAKDNTVRDLLAAAISRTTFFAAATGDRSERAHTEPVDHSARAQLFVEKCAALGHGPLACDLVARLAAQAALPTRVPYAQRRAACSLFAHVRRVLRAVGHDDTGLRRLLGARHDEAMACLAEYAPETTRAAQARGTKRAGEAGVSRVPKMAKVAGPIAGPSSGGAKVLATKRGR